MARKYEELAAEIIRHVGGVENVETLAQCVTRLRFMLKDEKKANISALKKLDSVLAVMQSGGQCQIVIGETVGEVYAEILRQHDIKPEEETEVIHRRKMDALVGTISGIFMPLLGLLAAGGMLKGMVVLIASFKLVDTSSGTYQILNVLSDSFFYFMPIFLGCTAAKNFRMSNEYTAMAIGAALVYPSLEQMRAGEVLYEVFSGTLFASPIHIEFLGVPVILVNYATSIIPIILSVWVASKIERVLLRIIPPIFKSFGVTFIMLLIMIPLTLLVVGPISTWLGQAVGAASTGIFGFSPMVAGFLLGGFWQILVMFGLHWGLVMVMLSNIVSLGSDPIVAITFGASFAQTGAVLAILIRTKDKKLRGIALPAFISGIFGITEPAIYGVTLPRVRFFVISCIGAAIGGALGGFLDIRIYIFGGMGIFEYPCFINPATNDVQGMYNAMIVSGVSFALGFLMSLPLYLDKKAVKEVSENIGSPLTGRVVALKDVPDESFAEGVGVAIEPESGEVLAPVDAEVAMIFPTNHAIWLKTKNDVEILIHVGLDTTKLDGDGFNALVALGDKVKRGQRLIEFDLEKLKAAGCSTLTPVLVANYSLYADAYATDKKAVKVGDKIITVIF
ncbi:MAG: PTS glucose transporter subunit IIA [Selenomonadaceae bacterium]|nr:PTS glucose transporter subunit IIA [Selenomonadaceae bacterium]